MKKISILFALILCFAFQSNGLAADATKVAIVDLQRCMRESNEGKRLTESLKTKADAMQQRYNKAYKDVNDLSKEIEKQSLMLSLEAKASKQSELDKKKRDLTYLEQDLEEEQTAAQQSATQSLLKDIYTVCESIAKQQGFDLVIEKSTSGIIYTSSALDVTDQIIKEYNKVKP